MTGHAGAVDRTQILAKLNSGDAQGAIALIEEALAGNPDSADLLGLLGIAHEEAGDIDAALDCLRRSLPLPADISIRLRNLSNLAAMLWDKGEREQTGEVLRQGWRWPEERAAGPDDRRCVALITQMMSGLRLHAELIALAGPLVARGDHDWAVLRPYAIALAQSGSREESLRLVEAYGGPDRKEAEAQALLGHLYWQTKQPERAEAARLAHALSAPPLIAPAAKGQRFTVGVIENPPGYAQLIHPAHSHFFTGNYPQFISRRLADRYRFAGILLGAGPQPLRQFKASQPRVLINNVVNSEVLLSGDVLATATRLVEALGLPVINPPERAAGCTRQMNAQRLRNIPGLIVPKVSRFNRNLERTAELVALIEAKFAYPFILRTTTAHNSSGMNLVRGRESLMELLPRLEQQQFYVIQYIGEPRRDGFYRRIRAAFVQGEPVIVRADYTDEWIVRSRNYVPPEIYRDRPGLLAEANGIIDDPVKMLGAPAMAVLNAVGRAMPLDVFGMDFDVDGEGRVRFFEANPSMNFRPLAPKEFPYPLHASETFAERMAALIERLASLPASAAHSSSIAAADAKATRH